MELTVEESSASALKESSCWPWKRLILKGEKKRKEKKKEKKKIGRIFHFPPFFSCQTYFQMIPLSEGLNPAFPERMRVLTPEVLGGVGM